MKILDTDHCVAVLRGRLDLRGRAASDEALALTTISIAELVFGAHKSNRSQENLAGLDVFLAGLEWLPFDERSARRYGYLRARLEKQGVVLSDLDLQIASIALEAGAPLLTHNRRHFERLLPECELALDDWLA